MKKYLLITFLYFSFIQGVMAQLTFKAVSGVNLAWQGLSSNREVDFSSFEELNYLKGSVVKPFIGLQLNKEVNHFLDLNFEFQVSIKGQKSNSSSYSETLSYLKYVQTFDINVWKNLKFGGGMFWGLLLESEFEGISQAITFNRDDFESGLVSSISYQKSRFLFRLVYYHSITKLYRQSFFNNTFTTFLGSAEIKNRAFQFGIGYDIARKEKSKKPAF